MTSREEVEQLITQAASKLSSAQAVIATAMRHTTNMANEESDRGHDGTAATYLAAASKLEESSRQVTVAIVCAEESNSFVGQT